MTERTLRDLLVEASEGLQARDLANAAITEARRRGRRRRITAGAVTVAVAAAVMAVIVASDDLLRDTAPGPEDTPAPVTRPTAPTPSSSVVGGWEILGKERWFPLTNRVVPLPAANYHAAAVRAVNRSGRDLSPRHGLVLEAGYENAPGMFSAACEVVEIDVEPREISKQELRAAPLRQTPVPPGSEVVFACFQTVGTLPSGAYLPTSGRLRIDVETARFRDW